jgi:hypothetical protein
VATKDCHKGGALYSRREDVGALLIGLYFAVLVVQNIVLDLLIETASAAVSRNSTASQ